MKSFFTYIKNSHFILIFLLAVAVFLRFYDLNWGAPFYFHPDERNIASSISQLYAPEQLNPHFFAYGSLPIYSIYFTGVIINSMTFLFQQNDIWNVSFEQAIIIGRFFSAGLSIGTLALLYFTALHYISKKFALITVFLSTLSVGLIQYAHFGTFEMYLTFFSLLLLYQLVLYLKTSHHRYFLFTCITLGILISIKISSLALFPLPILVSLTVIKNKRSSKTKRNRLTLIKKIGTNTGILAAICIGIFILTNPFSFLDWSAFRGSMQYESAVALGTLPVFYTGTFTDTIPGIYQALYVLPYLLNPFIAAIFVPAFIIILLYELKKRDSKTSLLIFFFLFLLIPQLVFFVKWTRYFVPLLPVIYLIVALSLSVLSKKHLTKNIHYLITGVAMVSSVLWTAALLKTVYIEPDTRTTAAIYANEIFSQETKILSEVYDLGIMPFNEKFTHISLFNFYDLEHNPDLANTLSHEVSNHDIIILPSQRIIKSRLDNPQNFPHGHMFYSSLISSTRFTQVYQTPCDFFCKILYLGDPVYGVEDTANVFDRPTVSIFKINHER